MAIIMFLLLILPVKAFSQRLQGIEGTTQEARIADYSSFFGIRATGMGGAHIAISNDYSATYYNPANLAFITRIELSGALSHKKVENNSELNKTKASRNLTKTRIEYLGGVAALPVIRGGAAVGIGYNRVNSFDRVLFARDSTRKALELSSGGLYSLALAGGIQVAEGLGWGATIDIYNGEENYGWDLEKHLSLGELQKIIISDNIKYKYKGVGFKMGLTYNPIPIFRASGVIYFPGTLSIDENGTQRTDSIFSDREKYSESSNIVETYKISLPYSFGVGIGIDLTYVVVDIDADYTDWSQLEYKSPIWILSENKYFSNSYRGVLRIRAGVEGMIPIVGAKVRIGAAREPLPYKAAKIEKDRYSVTLGAGLLVAKLLSVDIATVFSGFTRLDQSSNLLEEYKFTKFDFGISYRF